MWNHFHLSGRTLPVRPRGHRSGGPWGPWEGPSRTGRQRCVPERRRHRRTREGQTEGGVSPGTYVSRDVPLIESGHLCRDLSLWTSWVPPTSPRGRGTLLGVWWRDLNFRWWVRTRWSRPHPVQTLVVLGRPYRGPERGRSGRDNRVPREVSRDLDRQCPGRGSTSTSA